METLFIILTIWLAPIILIILMLYLMMEKGQTVEDFAFQYDLDDSSFWVPYLFQEQITLFVLQYQHILYMNH